MWAEDQIKLEWAMEKARIQEHIRREFSKTFPNQKWQNLQKQHDRCLTDDGCIYYKTKTNVLYSWNTIAGAWQQPDEDRCAQLLPKLFSS
jgi:hypothetical protein